MPETLIPPLLPTSFEDRAGNTYILDMVFPDLIGRRDTFRDQPSKQVLQIA